jgi:uncharacterized glyoxalase superfamily protein PhnB
MVVDAVEPCLQFWTDRFGFSKENEVPGDDGTLVFASVKKNDVEVMYQTRRSVLADMPSTEPELSGHSVVLFLTVEDLDATESALAGAPVVKPRHKTFYGSEEIYVREPGGNIVGFATFGS